MTTPKEMRERAKIKIVATLREMGFALPLDCSYDEITNAISIALTGYGRFGPSEPEKEDDTRLTSVGRLGYILWRCATGLGFSGSKGLNEISDLLSAAIDERVKAALSDTKDF